MGYALFTARKMSLQSKVNNYNLQLMKINNRLEQLTNKSAAHTQKNNKINAAQNTGSTVAKVGGTIAGFILGGPIGAMAGNAIGSVGSKVINAGIDKGQEMSDEVFQNKMAAEQSQLDTEKQRLTTLINAASQELNEVTEQEKNAIKNSTAGYVG